MANTVIIDLAKNFATAMRRGEDSAEYSQIQKIAKDHGLVFGALSRRPDNAAYYLCGAKAGDADVVAALKAVSGVQHATVLPTRKLIR